MLDLDAVGDAIDFSGLEACAWKRFLSDIRS